MARQQPLLVKLKYISFTGVWFAETVGWVCVSMSKQQNTFKTISEINWCVWVRVGGYQKITTRTFFAYNCNALSFAIQLIQSNNFITLKNGNNRLLHSSTCGALYNVNLLRFIIFHPATYIDDFIISFSFDHNNLHFQQSHTRNRFVFFFSVAIQFI